MRLERVERLDDKVVVVIDAQTSGLSIWNGTEEKTWKLKYIGEKSWGFVEKLEFTADAMTGAEILIQEWEWGRNGKKRVYKLNITNDSVTIQKIKDEYTGWVRILR